MTNDDSSTDDYSEYFEVRRRLMRAVAATEPSPALGIEDTSRQVQDCAAIEVGTYVTERPQTLSEGTIHLGDAQELLTRILPNSVALSVWSPPYFVGKEYEADLKFEDWTSLLRSVIAAHFPIIRPGGFVAINIADILCYKDEKMPRLQAEVIGQRRSSVTRQDVLDAKARHPEANRNELAALLGCSEQTVDRRLNGNNIRGGKYDFQTRVKLVGGLIEQWALEAGFYPYDRRIWIKDAAWENSRWASSSYRAVDEFEYIYFLWKPGVTTVDRSRLTPAEWTEWGARGVWHFRSVRANDDHEAKFPLELPRRVIRLLTDRNDLVLDCFMGSGTTAIAAVQEGRRFLGIEREPRYVQLGLSHVSKMLAFPHVDRPKQHNDEHLHGRADRKGLDEASRSSSVRFPSNCG